MWPPHCVQDTSGADFHPELDYREGDFIVYKGTDSAIDSYSAFYDNQHKKSTGLSDYLKEKGVTSVYLTGIASDVCVYFSAIDAKNDGFDVYYVKDLCRGLSPADIALCETKMGEAGVNIVASTSISL